MINIQEQFSVNIGLPIDSRIVASGSSERTAITYKYDGLLVYDTSDRKTYAWNQDTSSWVSSDLGGVGTPNYLAKWSSTGLTQSPIYTTDVVTGKIGINTSDPKGVLQINSDVSAANPEKGLVFHSDPDYFLIGRNWWYGGGSDQFFNSGVGSNVIKFKNNGEILFYIKPPILSSALDSGDNSTDELVKFGVDNNIFRKDLILWRTNSLPGVGQYCLFLRPTVPGGVFESSANFPDITWYNDDKTGIFHPTGGKIGFSIYDGSSGVQKAMLTKNGLLICASANLSSPNYRLHIDGGNSLETYLQFTNGTTTGLSTSAGFLIGLNPQGWPVLNSQANQAMTYQFPPIIFGFGKDSFYQIFKKNKIVMSADSIGADYTKLNAVNGGSNNRVERISISGKTTSSGSTIPYILEVPSGTYLTVEATFTTYIRYSGSSYHYRSYKCLSFWTCALGGSVVQNGSTQVLGNISSPSGTTSIIPNFGTGVANQLQLYVTITESSINEATCLFDITASFVRFGT
jgi:hypothetical protein